MRVFLVIVCGGLLTGATSAQDTSAPEWSTVRSIIEQRCLSCHGGDTVRSGLQLVDAEHFRRGGDRGPLLDPDAPEKGRFWQVTSHENPDLAMPPSGVLPASELKTLRAWIRAGAPWPEGEAGRLAEPRQLHEDTVAQGDWWAYRPLEAPVVPHVEGADLHPIDAFVLHGLEQAGLQAPAQASDEILLRRLHLGLTGLPPTPAERQAFKAAVAASDRDTAFREAASELLKTVQHGEHMARRWLDLVRFAETNGYERDTTKLNIWRYRDWVIRAFRDDLPYDRFLTWQLAGDEWAAMAGERASANEKDDAWIATGYLRLGVWDDEPADRAQAYADEIADVVDVTSQVFLATTFGCARCHDHKADPIRQADYFGLTAAFVNLKGFGAKTTRQVPDPRGPETLEPAEQQAMLAEIDARLRARLDAMPELESAQLLPARTLVPSARESAHRWALHMGDTADGWEQPGFDDRGWKRGAAGFGARGTPGSIIGTVWQTPQIHLRTTFRLDAIPDALHIDLHHDDDVTIWLNGQQVFHRKGYITAYRTFQLDEKALEALVVGRNVLAVHCKQDFGGRYVDVGLRTGIHGEAEGAWRARLLAAIAGRAEEERQDVDRLLAERKRVASAPVARPYPALVAGEHGSRPRRQRIHLRGSVHAPGEVVPFALPAAFRHEGSTGLPEAEPVEGASTGRRLALARWMTGEGAFLTARVIANRVWQVHFGRGLCRTSGDFGRLGDRPTHPELLDHLAHWLIAHDWSLRALHQHILTSRTWQASSHASAEALERDPRNDRYSRFDARRLTAEEYRDSVLLADGSLERRSFGPSVYPPLSKEVLATSSRPNSAWGRSGPEDAARRSIYVFTKRSLRMPLLEAFDQPDPDMACPDRFPTNVPTQALMTLNGPFVQRAAARMADRLGAMPGSDAARVRAALSRALAREPSDEEVERHVDFLVELREDHGLDEQATLRTFAVALFNLNAFFWVD